MSQDRERARWSPSLALYAVFLLFGPIARAINATWPSELIPPLWVAALWVVPLSLFAHVRGVFNRFIAYGWIAWALVGSVNVIASYLFYGDYYLVDVERADLIYIEFTTAFFLGLICFERLFPGRRERPRAAAPIHPWILVVLLAFPFVWFASVYSSIGYIPVFAQLNVLDNLYELDYGPLYGFTVVLALSMVTALDASTNARSTSARWLLRGAVVLFAAFSFMTSKRETVIATAAAAFVYLVQTRGTGWLRGATLGVVAIALVAFYIGGELIRDGFQDDEIATTELQLSLVGVEYRDYVYSVDNFEPGRIPDYDWAASTAAAMINSTLLDLAGVNKEELAKRGSANAWKPLFGSEFGVRTGIVSELYFAYEHFGVLIVFAFGLVSAWVSRRIATARTKLGLVFAAVIYAFLLLSVVSQSTEAGGAIATLLYVWLALWAIRSVAAIKRGTSAAIDATTG